MHNTHSGLHNPARHNRHPSPAAGNCGPLEVGYVPRSCHHQPPRAGSRLVCKSRLTVTALCEGVTGARWGSGLGC
jgi:hypothetical protein